MRKVLSILLSLLMVLSLSTINVAAEGTQTLEINVTYEVENNNPVITGVKDKTIFVGEKFNSLEGVSASDREDGELEVTVVGTVDTNKAGEYMLTYTVSDNDGGNDTKNATIKVIEKLVEGNTTVDTTLDKDAPVEKVEADIKADNILNSAVKEEGNKTSNLTSDQKQAIKDGADVKIELVVDKSNATIEDADKIEKAVKDSNSNTNIGTFLDLSIICTVTKNNSQVGTTSKINETSEPVKVSVTVPEELKNNNSDINRTYDVARLHDGTVELLGATYDLATNMLTFLTDKFSTYAIVYTDTKIESAPVYIPKKKKPVVNTEGSIIGNNSLELDENGNGSKVLHLEDSLAFGLRIKFDNLQLTRENGTETIGLSVILKDEELTDNGDYLITEDNDYIVSLSLTEGNKARPGKYAGTVSIIVGPTAGTESDPHHISDEEDWLKLSADALNLNGTSDKYYVVEKDLDFTGLSQKVGLRYFAGNIDFQGHSITGLDGSNTYRDRYPSLFKIVKNNAAIKNLKYELPNLGTDNTVKPIGSIEGNGSVTLENISISGNLNMTDNNTGLLVDFIGGNSKFDGIVNLIGCTSTCNMINNGFSSAFIGGIYRYDNNSNDGNNITINALDCVNYGKILSTGAQSSMIISNGTRHAGDNLTLNITNCRNEGQIIAAPGKSSYLAMPDVGGESAFYNAEQIKAFETSGSIVNANGGISASLNTGELSITGDGSFDLITAKNKVSDAVRFELSFGFQGTGGLGAGGVTSYSFTFDSPESVQNVSAAHWVNASEAIGDIVAHNEFGTTYYTDTNGNYVYNYTGYIMNKQPEVSFIAYDANGNVMLVDFYSYSN